MTSLSELEAESSPDILCVSDSRESNAIIRDAVASHRPAERIETTTDPTVVPELVAAWGVDCVVADAEMGPLDGFDLRSSLTERDPQLSAIVVLTEPAVDDAVAVVAADTSEFEGFATCLDQARTRQDTTAGSGPNRSACRLDRLVEADSQCDVVHVLGDTVQRFPAVLNHQLWLADADGSLEPPAEAETNRPAIQTVVNDAVETGEPQQLTEPAADATSTNRRRTAVYPLGETGAIVVELALLTPAVATRLNRLATVAGACLDHHAAVDDLETRFRQTAERNRQLSQFARTVAHDLNSPLSVIYGRIDLALADHSDAEIHLRAARNAAQRVDSLITDHLQTVEAAEAEADHERVSVQTVAIQAWRIIDPSTARLQIEPQLETVEANAIRLQQLFENLIRNAIEHGSAESVGLGAADSRDPHAVFDDEAESVTVTIKPTDKGFAVCDDGPGIPADKRDSIFNSGYTTAESGSGLGLHIVQEIVDSHGWEISVTDSDSGGARFEVDTE